MDHTLIMLSSHIMLEQRRDKHIKLEYATLSTKPAAHPSSMDKMKKKKTKEKKLTELYRKLYASFININRI